MAMENSIVVACDAKGKKLREGILKIEGDEYLSQQVFALKVDLDLVLTYSLPGFIEILKKFTKKPILIDCPLPQTEETTLKLVELAKDSNANGIIGWPSSLKIGNLLITKSKEYGLDYIVGGEIETENFIIPAKSSKARFIGEMYSEFAKLGADSFYMPSSEDIEKIKIYYSIIKKVNGEPILYSPCLIPGQDYEMQKCHPVINLTKLVELPQQNKGASDISDIDFPE